MTSSIGPETNDRTPLARPLVVPASGVPPGFTGSHAAVIIPVWNGRDDLHRCLTALLAQEYPAFRVIAVDNGSDDGSADLIADAFPTVEILRQGTNLGFAGACNLGLRHATCGSDCADILVLLNQDTEVAPDWLAHLVDALEHDPGIGMAGSKALYPSGAIQHAGATLDPQVGGHHIGVGEEDHGQYDSPAEVDFLSGVSLAVSRQLYHQIGGLDEAFTPAYFEDVDWCYRARAAGFRPLYVPSSRLIHHEESVSVDGSYASVYSYQRNRLRLLLKHWPVDRLADEFAPAERVWLDSQRSAEFVTALQHAYFHHLVHLPEMALWRNHFLGETAQQTDQLFTILLELHTVTPLTPLWLPPSHEEGANSVDDLIAQAARLGEISPVPFRSEIPLFGPLVAWFRERWNRVATRWFVLPMVAQQNRYNQALLEAVAQLHRERTHLVAALIATDQVRSREIGELIDLVHRQQSLLDDTESASARADEGSIDRAAEQ